jgi:hypothetical protein
MIVHDRKRQAVNGEDGRREIQSLANRLVAMFARSTRQRIIPTQKRLSPSTLPRISGADRGYSTNRVSRA